LKKVKKSNAVGEPKKEERRYPPFEHEGKHMKYDREAGGYREYDPGSGKWLLRGTVTDEDDGNKKYKFDR
jgi:hypothetical protein